MSKSTIFIIVILLLAIFTYLAVKNSYITTSPLQVMTVLKPTPTPETLSSMALLPAEITVIPNKRSTINVALNHQGYPPTIIQLELAYDPSVITDIQIKPGNFYTNPTVLLQSINENVGRISYALAPSANEPFDKKKGVVASISFQAKPDSTQSESSFYFLQKSAIKIHDEINSLKAAYGTKLLLIKQSIPSIFPTITAY